MDKLTERNTKNISLVPSQNDKPHSQMIETQNMYKGGSQAIRSTRSGKTYKTIPEAQEEDDLDDEILNQLA